jgi:pimeloyl-ACP methyl ester carboxylesterase
MSLHFVSCGGAGPPALLIHGFGGDHLSWLANQNEIATEATTQAVDLPGHGESSLDVGDGDVETLAAMLVEALDERPLGRIHLIGHSLGGVVAMKIAQFRPDLVASLILITPAGLGGAIDADFLARFSTLVDPDDALALLQRLVSRPRLINRHMVARVLDQLGRPGAREALARIADALPRARLDEAAAAIVAADIPRLVVWGAADAINPLHELALASFGGERLIVPDAGHMPHVEAARVVNARCVAFLQRQRTGDHGQIAP